MGKKRGTNKSIKPPKVQSNRMVVEEKLLNYDEQYILFSLERVQEGGEFGFSTLQKEEKADFAETIFKRKNQSWKELKRQDRHALGFEKIAKESIKTSIPQFITEDSNFFLAFRFSGKKPMVGYRLKNIFYVLWFDRLFSLYKH